MVPCEDSFKLLLPVVSSTPSLTQDVSLALHASIVPSRSCLTLGGPVESLIGHPYASYIPNLWYESGKVLQRLVSGSSSSNCSDADVPICSTISCLQ